MAQSCDGTGEFAFMNQQNSRGKPPPSNAFTEAMSTRTSDTIDMVHDALNDGRVILAYQPVVQTVSPDQVGFYEGLARVIDPQGRIIPAKDFITEIEDQPTGRQLDTLALRHGLATLASVPGLRLSINMSARSIGYPAWNDALQEGLNRDPTIAERLILEITERTARSTAIS
jgi:EAL domain-containing protein (putative c-di-GMP-specific phosphodiesterase class I)